jgi:hypothetical protein
MKIEVADFRKDNLEGGLNNGLLIQCSYLRLSGLL